MEDNTIIIGAGPAGLAVGACLKKAGSSFLILEKSDKVGSSWRQHYDRLHLHTDKSHSTLPFMDFPRDWPRYISRVQLIEYLEAYAQKFQLEPKFGQQVKNVQHLDGIWQVKTPGATYQARNLVVATGYPRQPHLPAWPGQDSFQGDILHSAAYKNGTPYKNKNVLVVGFGNSGGEIAVDLWEHGARPGLAVRSPVNVIPRELLGIPILTIGIAQRKLPPRLADMINGPILRVVMGDLSRYGLPKLPHGPITQIEEDARIPLIDVGTIQRIKDGHIRVHPGIEEFNGNAIVFTDGTQADFDAVILATGYRPRVSDFLEGLPDAYDDEGTPLSSGRETVIPGLYFCGFYVSPTGMLREIAIEAQQISTDIANRSGLKL
ncbi:MAG: NAD(P)/FAD-dependent oxidoreductase [Chloroflexi bacterium]|nr:NAD(P)/FAD-dependent oxidoreductase [Chloroflexota bacterium]